MFVLTPFVFPDVSLGAPARINLYASSGHALESVSTEFIYLGPDELLNLMRAKKDIVIVDARPEDNFEFEHIRGAINLPWAARIKEPVEVPRHRRIILYCDCSNEETSIDLARQLIGQYGFDNSKIMILKGGLEKWKDLGYPMDR